MHHVLLVALTGKCDRLTAALQQDRTGCMYVCGVSVSKRYISCWRLPVVTLGGISLDVICRLKPTTTTELDSVS